MVHHITYSYQVASISDQYFFSYYADRQRDTRTDAAIETIRCSAGPTGSIGGVFV